MTYSDSVLLAKKLKALSPAISSVELFGSVLHKGHGRDADFLILVDETLAKRWWSEERESIRVRWPDALYKHRWIVKKFAPFAYAMTVNKRRRKRLQISADMLNIPLQALADSSGVLPDFEMFLMPTAWRIGTEINIDIMRRMTDLTQDKNTLGFLERVAQDAVRVA